jgi:hypothetical protein
LKFLLPVELELGLANPWHYLYLLEFCNISFPKVMRIMTGGEFSLPPFGGVKSPIFQRTSPQGPSIDTSTKWVFALMSIMHYTAIKVDEIRQEKCVCQPDRKMSPLTKANGEKEKFIK